MSADGNPLAALTARAREQFLTREQYSTALAEIVADPDLGLAGLQFVLTRADEEFTVGVEVDGDAHLRMTQDAGADWSVALRMWRGPQAAGTGLLPTLGEQAWECFDAWWMPDARDALTGLPSFTTSPEVPPRAEGALRACVEAELPAAVIMLDLDRFKAVNDGPGGHLAGDQALRLFARTLEQAAASRAVVMRRGGDEFAVFAPDVDEQDAVELAIRLVEQCRQTFDEQPYDLGVTAGITMAGTDPAATFGALLAKADKTLIDVKQEAKGAARFSDSTDVTTAARVGVIGGAALVKSAVSKANPAPFANVWLNVLARRVSRAVAKSGSVDGLQDLVDGYLQDAQLAPIGDALPAALSRDQPLSTGTDVSAAELGLAVACGLFHAAARTAAVRAAAGSPILRFGAGGVRLSDDGGKVLWEIGALDEGAEQEVAFGGWWTLESDLVDEQAASLCLLVQIGNRSADEIPDWPLAERIHVDPRPHSGGGLPDFWQLTLARVIDALERRPNVVRVAVAGALDHGRHSVEWLESAASWKSHELQNQLMLPYEQIERAKQRLDGIVAEVSGLDDLLLLLADEVRGARTLSPTPPPTRPKRRVLSASVPFGDYQLDHRDGCKVPTIREAFPIVLAALRDAAERDETQIHDETGETLVELLDYKIELSAPRREQIPDYLDRHSPGEQSDLEHYFERNFLAADGKFTPFMTAPDVLDPLLEHLEGTMRARPPHVTRRALLVVPHEIEAGVPLGPLGLIAMRCTPRPVNDRVNLYFSLYWRTVEAFIGLPYSLYGSVKLAEHVTQELRRRFRPGEPRLHLAGVTYVASSLHMYIDALGQNIARRIVNDARR
jgi:diguanylate cyclase (GGDEF)-like protein